MIQHLVLVHALTPIHVGVGQGVGDIDLPTAREKSTGHPFLPGTGFKGVARERALQVDPKNVRAVFGDAPKDTPEDTGGAGSVVFSDLRLVCLPVRSYFGTMAWATCPFVLRRLARDMKEAGIVVPAPMPRVAATGAAVSGARNGGALAKNGKVWLEDFSLDVVEGDASAWANWIAGAVLADEGEKSAFRERFLVVHDEVFDYLCDVALEVRPRVRLEVGTKVAAGSGSWLEESIPAESVLIGLVQVIPRGDAREADVQRSLDTVLGAGAGGVALQVGGKASVGLGRVRAALAKGGAR